MKDKINLILFTASYLGSELSPEDAGVILGEFENYKPSCPHNLLRTENEIKSGKCRACGRKFNQEQ